VPRPSASCLGRSAPRDLPPADRKRAVSPAACNNNVITGHGVSPGSTQRAIAADERCEIVNFCLQFPAGLLRKVTARVLGARNPAPT